MRKLIADESGVTTTEFALAAPIVILILVVCLDFARGANAFVIVANASREGARYASAQSAQLTSSAVKSYVVQRIAPLDPAAMQVTASYVPTTDPRWPAGAPAPWTVTVSVRYDWSAATALTGSFFALVSGSHQMESSSSMETYQ